jgi:OPT oligopeptide transporter protein
MTIYYGNIWRAQDFPFLSQLLFTKDSNSTSYQIFNQTNVLNDNGYLDPAKLEVEGVPYMAATFASYVLTQNLAITATITHMLLYKFDDLKSAWSFMKPSYLKTLIQPSTWRFWETEEPTEEEILTMDPHHRLMLKYTDAPNWWYGLVFIAATIVGIVCIYKAHSGMSWWAFIIATILASIFILFVGAQAALTGFSIPVQPLIQMIGAYLEPGNPLTNM